MLLQHHLLLTIHLYHHVLPLKRYTLPVVLPTPIVFRLFMNLYLADFVVVVVYVDQVAARH